MTTAPGPVTTTRAERGLPGGVGDSPARPDGRQKVTGEFAYSSDLWLDGMLWGATLRSPHPRARLIRLDISGALTVPGVAAVLTHEDVPGARTYGLEHKDQPVLAWDQVRYQGEPVALVAADHPETARRAAARIGADYEVLPPVTGARAALDPDAPALHEGGNLVRHVRIRKGRPGYPPPTWWSAASTRSACRTRRSSAPSRAWPCPPRTAASTCSWPPSGCTWTGTRSRPASACPATRCGSPCPASAGRSGPARTCPCRSTPACSRCAPASRSRWCTPARSPSSGTCTGTRPRCATSTAARRTGGWSTSRRTSSWTAARTRRARPPSRPTRRPSASARTRCRM